MKTLRKDVKVGIYDSAYVARIYPDRIVLTTPYVKWVGNTGSYDERKTRIDDQATLARVEDCLVVEATESAWAAIGLAVDDDWLMHAEQ